MPSTSTSITGNSESNRSACSAACSRLALALYRLRNCALAAGPCNRYFLSRPALLSACSTGTQRSSARLITTLDQSSACLARCWKNATGLRPPDTTSVAVPWTSIASLNCLATFSARLSASSTGLLNAWARTPCGSFKSDIAIPRPPVPREQSNGAHRPPGPGRVRLGRITGFFPPGDQLVTPLPRGFDFIFTDKQVLIAAHHFQQQPLVGIGNPCAAPGVGKIQLQWTAAQLHALVQALFLGHHTQGNAFVRLQADNQLVADLQALLGSENVVRRFLEVDDDLRQLLRHALAGTQVKRHAGPAPVADVGAQGDKGFGIALGVGIGFFQVPRHRFAFAVAGDVLAAHHL